MARRGEREARTGIKNRAKNRRESRFCQKEKRAVEIVKMRRENLNRKKMIKERKIMKTR